MPTASLRSSYRAPPHIPLHTQTSPSTLRNFHPYHAPPTSPHQPRPCPNALHLPPSLHPQFTDQYRAPARCDVCMVPGNVPLNQFTVGASAMCGGVSGGVTTVPIGSPGTGQVGRLLVWKSLEQVLYLTMLLDCAADGALVSAGPQVWLGTAKVRDVWVVRAVWQLAGVGVMRGYCAAGLGVYCLSRTPVSLHCEP